MAAVQCNPRDHELVLVTGASGYIASQIVDLLLRNGYRVRGTVRSITNEMKVRPLLNLCPDSTYPLELVEADLNNHDSWDRAVRGCRYVLHVACPFPAEAPKDEDEIIKPAVNGTLSILQASHKHRVKRVVYTSSIVAISDIKNAWMAVEPITVPRAMVLCTVCVCVGDFSTKDPPGKVFTEDDWTDPETAKDAYIKAKTLAERAAWDFVAQLPEGERFELVALNPMGVYGPILCGELGTIAKIVKKVLAREIPLIPKINFGAVDIRDVALAHMHAMTLPQAAGKRIIVHSGTNLWMEDIAKLLEHEFDPQGYYVPTTICPYVLMKLAAITDKTIRMVLPLYEKVQTCDDSKMKSILEITPRDVQQSVIDLAYSLIERGFVKKTKKYHGPPSDTNSSEHS